MPSATRRSRTLAQRGFSQVPSANIPRSAFNRSHGVKTTFDHGYLVPVYLDEVIPGDTHSIRPTLYARFQPLYRPVMDNAFLDMFFFFVPFRLVWNNFQKFMGEQTDPADSTDFEMPVMDFQSSTAQFNNLAGYFGLPQQVQFGTDNKTSLPFRSYALIWNEWFRDENLQDSITVDKDDGPDVITDYVLQKRGKRHDYFTSCLPWPQKNNLVAGGGAVTLPLGTWAPVVGDTTTDLKPLFDAGGAVDQPLTASGGNVSITSGSADLTWDTTKLRTDLTNATAATINAIREAFQVQRLYERDARGGTRYTEIIRSHFGVVSPDARLQRPEFLHSMTVRMSYSTVANTTSVTLGDVAAFGVGAGSGRGFTKSFTEHGYIIGLVAGRTDLSYQRSVDRLWRRQTRLDHYWPTFAHLGEQAVRNEELWYNNDANDDLVFGYQERYSEYRYKRNMITGKFNSDATGTLNVWHYAIDFASLPTLNSTFIQEDDTPVERALVAGASEPHYLFDAWFEVKSVRPMPTYSVPGLVDHF